MIASLLKTTQRTRLSRAFSTVLTAPKPSAESLKYSYPASLSNIPETRVTRLSNGFTVATESNPNNQTATVGVWIDAGSRFETAKTNGTAHFLEHMAFKGTKSRTQQQLESQIENMGGHLNAYTSREQTVYYAKALSSDVGASVEILADILQGSTLSADAIERERDVILRESEEVDKNKEEVVFDHLHGIAFQGSSLGRTILGPRDNIKSITRQDLVDYISENYKPNRMVLAAAGGVDHDALVKLAEKHFSSLAAGSTATKPAKAQFFGSDLRARFDNHPTAHIALAVEGVSWTSPDYWALLVAQSIIGSWDRSLGAASHVSSKLAQNVAKHGLANSFMSFNTSYSDTGLFGVYAVSENFEHLDDLTHYIQQEWHRLAINISEAEVFRAKNQLKTSLLLALDGTTPIAEDIGRQLLVYGKRLTPWEIDGLIERVTVADVTKVAGEYIYDREVAVVGYGPVEANGQHGTDDSHESRNGPGDKAQQAASHSTTTATATAATTNAQADAAAAAKATTFYGRTGGAYIPPARLRAMQAAITDRSSAEYQRMTWEALKKSLNGLINKVNTANIKHIVPELFGENLLRGRGLFCRSLMKAQAASLPFTPVYAALVAIVNTKFPIIGELLLCRLLAQFRRAFKRSDKPVCLAAAKFIAHLVNQRVANEIVALQILTLLLERPTDDSVEVAVGFIRDVGAFLSEESSRATTAVFERFRGILHEAQIEKRTQYMVEVLFQVRKDKFKDNVTIPEGLDIVEEADQITHLIGLTDELATEDTLN
eukprot:jgi/Hompol1/3414/HPOL_003232-RA